VTNDSDGARQPRQPRRPARQPTPRGTIRLGSIAGIDVFVSGSWFIIVGLIAIMFAPRLEQEAPGIGSWSYLAAIAFAVLLYLSVLLHEMSHALAARAFDMPVRSINLHFLGGATEIEGEATTPGREFVVAVVGPLTSLAVGGLGVLAVLPLDRGLLAYAIALLAGANLVVGALNLVPGLPLDGGRVLQAIVWRVSGNRRAGIVAAAWGGRLAALAVLMYPFVLRAYDREVTIVDYVIAFIIAAFLWGGASQALSMAKLRSRLPGLVARRLARPAIGVPADLPLSEAIRRAQEARAGSVVVVRGDGRPSGILSEAAVLSTPEERRPWLPVGDLARRLEEGLLLSADLVGEALIKAMNATPATEYVLVEMDGSVFGVLVTADVDNAFRASR
jgi:Zn-dependent protease/CBS domain-containing protein